MTLITPSSERTRSTRESSDPIEIPTFAVVCDDRSYSISPALHGVECHAMLRRNGKPRFVRPRNARAEAYSSPRSCEPCRISKIRCDHATPTCDKCKTRGITEQVSDIQPFSKWFLTKMPVLLSSGTHDQASWRASQKARAATSRLQRASERNARSRVSTFP